MRWMILAMVTAMGCTGMDGGTTSTTGHGGGTLTATGGLNGMAADYAGDDYAPGTNQSVYALSLSDPTALGTLGSISFMISVLGDVSTGEMTAHADRWSVIANSPDEKNMWQAHYDSSDTTASLGALTFDVTSFAQSPTEMSTTTHKAYQVHGSADATLDAVGGSGNVVTLHATF